MKWMTYNIKLGMQRGIERIAETISAQAPDVVALQEVGRHWTMGPSGDSARELSDLVDLPHYDFTTTILRERDNGRDAEYGHAVLSRWPLQHIARHDFTRDVDEPRAASIYRIEHPAAPVMLLSTHLSHLAPERAVHGPELVDLVTDLLAEAPHLFVAGDLNEADIARGWLSDLLELLDDAAPASRAVEPTFPAEVPELRIDYLLASSGTWTDYDVLEELFASDHRPVVASWSAG